MSRTEVIEAELATLCRVFMAEDTKTEERVRLSKNIDSLRAEFRELNADAIAAAQVTFATNKPNPPEHAEFMRRAAELYPALPPGAQQNALHCRDTLGEKHARRYATNASARHAQNERALMGTTLSAWRVKRSDHAKPYCYEGVCKWSPKRRREHAEFLDRYNAYMAEGKAKAAQTDARARKKAERRLIVELAAVAPVTNRRRQYQDILSAARNQTTGWLERCHAEPNAHQNAVVRLAVRNVLRERKARAPVDVVKPTAAPKVERAPRAVVVPQLVSDLVALLKSEQGATYAEAAAALKIQPKGDKPHQQPAAQVRALVRDKVRAIHQVIAAEHNSQRGGAVYRLQHA